MLESFLNKVAGLQASISIEKRLQHSCFPVNIAKFLRTPILRYIFERSNDCFCISETKTKNNVIYILPENFIFNFRIYKIFYLLSFLNFSCTEFVLAFIFPSRPISNISHNISNVSLSSSLSRLNAFGHYQKFVLISNAQNLSSGFI